MDPEHDDEDAVLDGLLRTALSEIRSTTASAGQRNAWACVAAFALDRLPETETRIAEALSTAVAVLHLPGASYRLVEGIWSCSGDTNRVRRWVLSLVNTAVRREQWVTFAGLIYIAVHVDGVERELSPEWERAVRAAYDIPDAWTTLFLFSHEYIAKFQPDRETAPDWLRLLYSDRRLQDSLTTTCAAEPSRCPLCRRVKSP